MIKLKSILFKMKMIQLLKKLRILQNKVNKLIVTNSKRDNEKKKIKN